MVKKKIIIASYRCPYNTSYVNVSNHIDDLNVGGVSRGLISALKDRDYRWFCIDKQKVTGDKIVSMKIGREDERLFYDVFCNTYLWPMFHYIRKTDTYHESAFNTYKQINKKFANLIASYQELKDQRVIVNDYQITLLPYFLRKAGFKNISFFWHIPWVDEMYISTLPWIYDIVNGILNADIIGFHTEAYKEKFREFVRLKLNIPVNKNRIIYDDREVKLVVRPFGIKMDNKINRIYTKKGNRKVIFSIDRLDFTKGILQKINAVEMLLESEPSMHSHFDYYMVVSPSRESISTYKDLKKNVEQMVGMVNGKYNTKSWTPIKYFYRKINEHDLIDFYKLADILIVTPFMDGLNLVTEEFIEHSQDGVIVISKFAGISTFIKKEVVIVNPYVVSDIYKGILKGLKMSKTERLIKMKKMKQFVMKNDVVKWLKVMSDE